MQCLQKSLDKESGPNVSSWDFVDACIYAAHCIDAAYPGSALAKELRYMASEEARRLTNEQRL